MQKKETGQLTRQFGRSTQLSIQALLGSTALIRAGRVAALGLAIFGGAIATTPAFAAPCTGAADNPTGPACDAVGSNGGGAGTIGGAGGDNGSPAAQGGQIPGQAGQDAATALGSAGGGGGGAHGYFGTDLPTGSAVTGGAGGRGGDTSGPSPTGAGGGGNGGFGAVVTGTGGGTLSVDVTGGAGGAGGDGGSAGRGGNGGIGLYGQNAMGVMIDSTVKGGRGGDGGSNGSSFSGIAGGGGTAVRLNGGSAIINGIVRGGDGGTGGTNPGVNGGPGGTGGGGISVSGTSGATITVNAGAEVTGGNGGDGGGGATNGSLGGGGIGIIGRDLTVINNGSISGGLSADGVTLGNAVIFSGGTNNVFELRANGSVNGIVRFQLGGTGKFVLGGDTATSTFDGSQLSSINSGANQYQGFTHFEKTGDSNWTVTGSNTGYTGDLVVSGGLLTVNGSFANATGTTVNAGMLTGTGTLTAVNVNAGAIFAPGAINTLGTSMTVSSLSMQSGATYGVLVNPSTSNFANVTGNASLGGATVVAQFANGSYIEKKYTILNAGSITGTFNSSVQNTNLPSGFKTSLSYDTAMTKAYLDLALEIAPPSGGGSAPSFNGLNPNQSNAGNAIQNFFNTTGSIPIAFGNATTPQALTQVSGEVGTSGQHTNFQAATQFMNVMGDVTSVARGGAGMGGGGAIGYADEAMAYAPKKKSNDARDAFASFTKAPPAPFAARWSTWAMGFGGSQTTDGNAAMGTNTASSNIYGLAVGADYRLSPDTVAGFALAGGGTNYSIVNGGTGRSDLFQIGAFVRQNFGATYLTASATYGWQDVKTDRYVTVAGVDHLKAEFNTNSYSGRVELGHRFLAPMFSGLGVTPYAAAQVTAFELPSYTEQAVSGANTFALNYNGQTTAATRSELGVRTDKAFALDGAILTLRGRAAWAHDFDPNSAVSATFQTLPGASFVVNGAALAPNSALTTASAELSWTNGWSIAGTFEGEFSNVTRSYAGKGLVRYNW